MEMVNFSATFKCLYETTTDERQFSRKKFHVRFRVSVSKTIIAFIALRRLRIMKFPVRFLIGRFQIIKEEKKKKDESFNFWEFDFYSHPFKKNLGKTKTCIYSFRKSWRFWESRKSGEYRLTAHIVKDKSESGVVKEISIAEANKRWNCEESHSHTSWRDLSLTEIDKQIGHRNLHCMINESYIR